MITPKLKISQSFAGYDKKGEQLSEVFERAFAQTNSAGTSQPLLKNPNSGEAKKPGATLRR